MRLLNKGFSLVELIVVIAVIAIISAVIIPSVAGSKEAAELQGAKAAAGALNMAQTQWRLSTGDVNSWSGAGNDADCYDDIKGYLEYADDTWTKFSARYPNYTLSFQSVSNGKMQKVVLTKKGDSTPIPY